MFPGVATLLADTARVLRWRAALLLAAMTANGLLEGTGLLLLFPLLARMGVGGAGAQNSLGRAIGAVLARIGVGDRLGPLLLVIVLVYVVQHTVFLAQSMLAATYEQRYIMGWRETLFRALFRARWPYFANRQGGHLANTLLNDTRRAGGALHLLAQAAASFIFVVVYIAVAFAAAWPIALVVSLFALVMSFAVRPLLRLGYRAGAQLGERMSALQILTNEFLAGAKLIKATATEDKAGAAFVREMTREARLNRAASVYPDLIRSIFEIAAIILLTGSLWLGLGVLGVDSASIMVSVYIFIRIYQRLSFMQQNLQALQSYAPAVQVLRATLDEAVAEDEFARAPATVSALPPESGGASIELDRVAVHYGAAAALDGVSLAIPAGSIVGIAGASGAGKSTLIDCILGLASPDAGAVLIDGRNLAALSLKAWRRQVGYVAQDTYLFNADIRANISWGNPDASDADIARAARQARAYDFIAALPQGFATAVGDRGVRLSGGERQRLGLAMALAGEARLLILDEATSALDSESERLVMDAIAGLRGRLTVIVIAHRLSTLRVADRIVFLEHGRLVEAGSWEELLQPGTRFHAMWSLQSDETRAMAK